MVTRNFVKQCEMDRRWSYVAAAYDAVAGGGKTPLPVAQHVRMF